MRRLSMRVALPLAAMWLWAAGATDASAVPAAALIAAGFSTTAATIAAAVINFAITTAVSMAVTALFAPKVKDAVAAAQADVTQMQIGETAARACFGRVRTGGALTDAFNWGASNEWEALVVTLASHEIDALEGYWVGDVYYPFTVQGDQPGFSDGGQSRLAIEFRNGVYPAVAPPTFLTQNDPRAERWVAEDRMHGRAWVAIAYRQSETVWTNGRPQITFLVRGAKLYDPRQDSTVAGGAGPQRFADRSTWTWSENGELIRANYAWGVHAIGHDGQPQLMVGPGRLLDEEPPEEVIVRANACDEDVALKAGGTEKRYRLGAVISADEPWAKVFEDMAACMGGEIVDRAGVTTIEPGVARIGPFAEFTDDDLIVGEPLRFQRDQARDRIVNAVSARFVDPAQLWASAAAPLRRALADVITDREPREAPLDLRFVTSQTQAQRIAEIHRRRARLEAEASVVLGARFMLHEGSDWIVWRSQRRFAGAARTFQILGASAQANGRTSLRLREIAADVYAWNAAVDELDRTTPAYLPAASLAPLAVAGFDVHPDTEPSTAGGSLAVIAVAWTPVTDPACTALRAEYRLVGATGAESVRFLDPAAGAGVIRASLDHDADYEVRLAPEVLGARRFTPTAWKPVRTDALVLDAVTGFTAVARADGVTLAWTASGQPEVVGYDLRRAASPATDWDDAAIVQTKFGATSTFIEIDDDAPVTFLIRAVDRQGRLSPEASTARVTASVVAPGDVASFESAPNGDLIRFQWTQVADANAGYEIRSGLTYDQGRVVDRASGDSTTVNWPIRAEADAIFWIKARSKAGLSSAAPRVTIARQAPTPDRNVIVERDLSDESWDGVTHDFTRDAGLLLLDRTGEVSQPFGDYYDEIALSQSFYARAWMNARAAAVVGDSPTWDEVDTAWGDLGDSTWAPPLGDAGTARLDQYIAPALAAAPASLVEGLRLAGTLEGWLGADPVDAIAVTSAPCKTAAGARVGAGRLLSYAIATPAEHSLLFDVRPAAAASGDVALLTLTAAGGAWVQIWRAHATGLITLTTSAGETCAVACPWTVDDVISIGVWQGATAAHLFAATRRDPAVREAACVIAAPAGYDAIYLGAPGAGAAFDWDDADYAWDSTQGEQAWAFVGATVGAASGSAEAVIGDVEIHESAAVAAVFAATWARRGPVGFDAYRTFSPGDYRFAKASIWLRLSAPDPVGQQLVIPEAKAYVDVPDVIDRGSGAVSAGPTTITFNRAFYDVPEVVVQQLGGATLAQAKVLGRAPDHFVVALYDATDTPVAGSISYAAVGF